MRVVLSHVVLRKSVECRTIEPGSRPKSLNRMAGNLRLLSLKRKPTSTCNALNAWDVQLVARLRTLETHFSVTTDVWEDAAG